MWACRVGGLRHVRGVKPEEEEPGHRAPVEAVLPAVLRERVVEAAPGGLGVEIEFEQLEL